MTSDNPPPAADTSPTRPPTLRRSRRGLIAGGVIFAVLFAGFTALGVWQVQRLFWKLDLIAQVDARIHAQPIPAPGPDAWSSVTRADDQYRHVRVSGVFRHDLETAVKAVTELDGGFWIITPLQTDQGFTVLINRGFVPPDRKSADSRPEAQPQDRQTVTGLLRITEPDGGFLQANDPAADRWTSRDVAAITAAKGLPVSTTAPYFIDADATLNPGGWPRGGMTVVKFANSHLVYALTWFGMAGMSAFGFALFLRDERRRRRQTS